MQPEVEGCSLAGRMWSYLSFAQCDLDLIWDTLSKLPRCDTKSEIVTQIVFAEQLLADMKRKVKEPGTAYTLEDAE